MTEVAVARATGGRAGSRRRRVAVLALALAALAALLTGVLVPAPAVTAATPGWRAAWAQPMNSAVTLNATNFTCRSLARVTAGGSSVRVRLSNLFVPTATTFSRVTVGRRSSGASIVSGTLRTLTFGGSTSVTVAAGAEVTSDSTGLTVSRDSDLVVSVFFSGTVKQFPNHALAFTSEYCTAGDGSAGDHAADLSESAFRAGGSNVAWVTEVDVSGGAATGTVVAIGDSITDGYGSSTNDYATWPDDLERRLAANDLPLSVINMGLGGNMVVGTNGTGPRLLDRLSRDAVQRAGASTVILMEGTNDVSPGGRTADEVIQGLQTAAAQLHQAGLRVIGGTIPPRGGCCGADQSSNTLAVDRINRFVSSSGTFDGVVDFAAAVRDPQNVTRLLPAFDSGDHLHPNERGYAAMADAVDLASLR